jgi:hypothetical protein
VAKLRIEAISGSVNITGSKEHCIEIIPIHTGQLPDESVRCSRIDILFVKSALGIVFLLHWLWGIGVSSRALDTHNTFDAYFPAGFKGIHVDSHIWQNEGERVFLHPAYPASTSGTEIDSLSPFYDALDVLAVLKVTLRATRYVQRIF